MSSKNVQSNNRSNIVNSSNSLQKHGSVKKDQFNDMAFYSSPFQIYKEANQISNKTQLKTVPHKADTIKNLLVTPTKSSELTPEESTGSGIKTNYIKVQKLSEFEKFYNNPEFVNSDRVRISMQKRAEEKLKKPFFAQEEYDTLYDPEFEQKLKNKKKESNVKEIFNSQGFYESSFSSNISTPQKHRLKIPNKGLEVGISEVIEESKESKKFRRNSCHTFTGKTGFYVC